METPAIKATEDFDQVLAGFKDFLIKTGYPTDVVWLTPDDVRLSGGPSIYVKTFALEHSEQSVREEFESGLQKGNGLLLKALFAVESRTFSCIWVPSTPEEAELAMNRGGVKFSVPATKFAGSIRLVKSELMWFCLSIRYRGKQELRSQLFS